MTIPPIASEAAASSYPDNDPWNEATPERLDQAARALTYNGSQQEGAAKHLLFIAGHRIEHLSRNREQMHAALAAAVRFEGAAVADLAKQGFFAAGGLAGVRHAIGKALAELDRLRKESKRERADKAEALLAEVARILGGTGDVVQRARTVTSKLRTTEVDREGMLQNLAAISTVACAESLEHYVPGCSWERAALGDVVKLVRKLHDTKAEVERVQAEHTKEVGRLSHDLTKARAERNEFAARQVEGFLDWARKPGSPWSGELRDAARARAAQLRLGDVRDAIAAVDLQFAADVKQALGVEPVAAPTEERVLFACSKCSPQNAKSIEDQINLVVSKRVEAERAKPLTGSWCGTGQHEMPPMRRDASGRIALPTAVRTPQCPRTEALADIAYCRRNPTLQEARLMAGELLDRRGADAAAAKGAMPVSQQAFDRACDELTRSYDVAALRRAADEGSQAACDELNRRARAAKVAIPAGQSSVLPLRFDDGRVLSVGSIAGQAHPDAQPDGFPAELTLAMGGMRCRYSRMDTAQRKAAESKQRFSLGTRFHDAMRRACGRGSGFSSGPIGFAALAEAVEALGAAVEADLSGRP